MKGQGSLNFSFQYVCYSGRKRGQRAPKNCQDHCLLLTSLLSSPFFSTKLHELELRWGSLTVLLPSTVSPKGDSMKCHHYQQQHPALHLTVALKPFKKINLEIKFRNMQHLTIIGKYWGICGRMLKGPSVTWNCDK